MKVLVSAYACSPYRGSEPGMGWGWIHALSKYYDLWVITEKDEFQSDIETELNNKPELRDRIRFYYIPRKRYKILEKIWPPSYYWSYKKWQKEAYTLAFSLHKEIGFDIVHQLNMTGYREPGYLWKLPLPFIWGPISGFMQMPWPFMRILGLKNAVFYSARNIINAVQMRFSSRVKKAMLRTNALIAATREDQAAIKKIFNKESILINETGVILPSAKSQRLPYNKDRALKLCWCGLIIGRKALPIALHAINRLQKALRIEFDIIGDGSERRRCVALSRKLGIDSSVKWHGWIEHDEAIRIISHSDIMLLTSIQDSTTSVVMEALYLGVPVICHDICGFGTVINEICGIKIPVINPSKSIDGFVNAISKLANNPALLTNLSNGAFRRACEFTWEHKKDAILPIYNKMQLNGVHL
ncbi:MAG: glycosyltransferase family 4 protein [Sedimentisphaerales bacterium]|nr:glycosyltransferase family 4 protein [Sedimentisphaerales bacterium]